MQSSALAAEMAVSANGNSNNNAVASSDSMGTWQLCCQHWEHGGRNRIAAMSVASIYDGSKKSPLHNILPAMTYATIAFSGMYIVQYCYTNIQDKHVVEMRLIAVIGILALSVVISLVSYGVFLVW